MNFKHFVLLLMFSSLAFASGDVAIGETDILERTINFIIFVTILYYLLSEPIKNFFVGRSENIANELNLVQEKLKESKRNRDIAESLVEDANGISEEILSTAKKESVILVSKINKQLESDLEIADTQHGNLKILEENKMLRGVVKEVISEIVSGDTLDISKEAVAEIIMKRVA